ncbi:MAG: conjugal transfer protein TraX [Muribaculum sp.]|nr:conjugal transfer protein TraX [Muribaculum sp.]
METETLQNTPKGVSAGVLKLFAVATMLIDHIAATVLVRMLRAGAGQEVYLLYNAMRQIGRIAFPIYCFLLVEGAERTRSRWKYAARLGAFALLSEIPFDLAFSSKVLELGYQNVFFTLFIGLVAVTALDGLERRQRGREATALSALLGTVLKAGIIGAAMGLAAWLRTDYDWRGVACILVMYLARRNLALELMLGYAAFVALLGEIVALPAFLALACYRGRKGVSSKFFFYGFYPVHLLLLYLICVLLRIARYPAV